MPRPAFEGSLFDENDVPERTSFLRPAIDGSVFVQPRSLAPAVIVVERTIEEEIFAANQVYEVWDYSAGVTVGALNAVEAWQGQIRGHTVVPDLTQKPILRQSGGLNNRGYVDFIYHTDNQLSVLFGESLPQPFTVLMVFTWVNFDLSAGIWSGIDPGGFPSQASFGLSSGNVILVAGSVGINCNGSGAWAGGNSHMMVNICDAGNNDARTYRGGTLFGSGDPVGAHTLDGFRFARFIGPAQSHNLHMYRAVILTYRPANAELNTWWATMGSSSEYNLPYTPL